MVVVCDGYNNRLALWHLGDGTVWKHLGSRGTDPGQYNFPTAVVVTAAGTLVVADHLRVQELTLDGVILCVLDPTAVVRLEHTGGVCVCESTGEILVTDYIRHSVMAFTRSPASHVRPFPAFNVFRH